MLTMVDGKSSLQLRKVWKWIRWVPHELNACQLNARIKICLHLLSYKRTMDWIQDLIIAYEKCILYVYHSRKRQ